MYIQRIFFYININWVIVGTIVNRTIDIGSDMDHIATQFKFISQKNNYYFFSQYHTNVLQKLWLFKN